MISTQPLLLLAVVVEEEVVVLVIVVALHVALLRSLEQGSTIFVLVPLALPAEPPTTEVFQNLEDKILDQN